MALSHHQHTGRHLPREHTSYAALAFITLLAGVMLAGVTRTTLAVDNPQTGYYGVSGVMPGAPPQKAPVILTPTNGQSFNSLPITVSGLCDKSTVVQIYKNDIFAGTASCQDNGSFELQIDLFEGTNKLVARAYDNLSQASPDSQAVSVTYHAQGSLNNFVNQVGQPLLIRADPTARGVKPGTSIEWTFEITGGKSPYAVNIDWGDSKNDLVSQQGEGLLKQSHTYDQPGRYAVVIRVTDSAGNRAYLQVLTVVDGSPARQNLLQIIGGNLAIAWPIYVLMALMLLSFWGGDYYRKVVDRSPKLPELPDSPNI